MQSGFDGEYQFTEFISELRNTAISVKQQSDNSLRNLSAVAGISAKQIHIELLGSIKLSQDDLDFLSLNGLDLRSLNFGDLDLPLGSWLRSEDFSRLCAQYAKSPLRREVWLLGVEDDPYRDYRVALLEGRMRSISKRELILQTFPNKENDRYIPYQAVSTGRFDEPVIAVSVDSAKQSGFILVINDGAFTSVINFPWENLLSAYCDGMLAVFGNSVGYCAPLKYWVQVWGGREFIPPTDKKNAMEGFWDPVDVCMISSSTIIVLDQNGILTSFHVTSGDRFVRHTDALRGSESDLYSRLQKISANRFGVVDRFGVVSIFTSNLEFVGGMVCVGGHLTRVNGSIFQQEEDTWIIKQAVGGRYEFSVPSLNIYETAPGNFRYRHHKFESYILGAE